MGVVIGVIVMIFFWAPKEPDSPVYFFDVAAEPSIFINDLP